MTPTSRPPPALDPAELAAELEQFAQQRRDRIARRPAGRDEQQRRREAGLAARHHRKLTRATTEEQHVNQQEMTSHAIAIVTAVLERGDPRDRLARATAAVAEIRSLLADSGSPVRGCLVLAELCATSVRAGAVAAGITPEQLWAQTIDTARTEAEQRDNPTTAGPTGGEQER